jgi:hypothetical protein
MEEDMEEDNDRPHLAYKILDPRRRARNIRLHGHGVRGVVVGARLGCWAFWSRASVIHVQGTIF